MVIETASVVHLYYETLYDFNLMFSVTLPLVMQRELCVGLHLHSLHTNFSVVGT